MPFCHCNRHRTERAKYTWRIRLAGLIARRAAKVPQFARATHSALRHADWIAKTKARAETKKVTEADLLRFGLKDADKAVEDFVTKNTVAKPDGTFECPLRYRW